MYALYKVEIACIVISPENTGKVQIWSIGLMILNRVVTLEFRKNKKILVSALLLLKGCKQYILS